MYFFLFLVEKGPFMLDVLYFIYKYEHLLVFLSPFVHSRIVILCNMLYIRPVLFKCTELHSLNLQNAGDGPTNCPHKTGQEVETT